MIPDDLKYTAEHEWVRVESGDDGKVATIGITDYAQDALGDVVFVQLPNVGDAVSAGQTFGEVESTKSVSDIYAPVAGTVVAVNDALVDSPQLLNDDPYGEGWICEIEATDSGHYDQLLGPAAYIHLVEG